VKTERPALLPIGQLAVRCCIFPVSITYSQGILVYLGTIVVCSRFGAGASPGVGAVSGTRELGYVELPTSMNPVQSSILIERNNMCARRIFVCLNGLEYNLQDGLLSFSARLRDYVRLFSCLKSTEFLL
jgi:hypothetical protein